MIAFEELGKLEILDPDLFDILLKYKENLWKRGKNHLLRFWHIKLRRLFGRLWLRLSPNIGVTEFLLLSGVTAKWFVSLQIRSRFGNLRLSIPSHLRKENKWDRFSYSN
jgi:hypothetical protein